MTDMQRWVPYESHMMRIEEACMEIGPCSEYVRVSDAEAAITAARADMLAKCIAAVEQALDKFWEPSDADELGWLEQHELYITALRALRDDQRYGNRNDALQEKP